MTTWHVLDEPTHTLTCEYSFSPRATSRSFATRFTGEELLIISPPVSIEPSGWEELNAHGRVTALIAPNGFHWLGLAGALQAFPEAKLFAPEVAADRIRKKQSEFSFHPLGELIERADSTSAILDVPGFSIGETWIAVKTTHGHIWYTGDSYLNMLELPKPWPVGMLFKWTKSAPALCMNGLGNLFFLKDKAAYKRFALEQLGQRQPEQLVPGRGQVFSEPGLADSMKALVEARV